ncbi:MAG: DUF3187 family protein [Pseudomonadota bacterium]
MPYRLIVSFLALACCLSAATSTAQTSTLNEPILVRATVPIEAGLRVSIDGRSELVDVGEWRLRPMLNLQSHSNVAVSDFETLILDGESHQVGVAFDWVFRPKWQFDATVLHTSHTNGSLDGAIDNWHDFFGLDEGDRPVLPRDGFEFSYANAQTATGSTIDQPLNGLQDIELGLTRQLFIEEKSSLAVRAVAQLPLNNAEKLLGSERVDFGLQVLYGRSWNGVGLHLNAGVTSIGDESRFGIKTEEWIAQTSAGFHWRPNSLGGNWRFSAQLDGRTRQFESELVELNDPAWTLALAAEYQLGSGSSPRLQVYFVEDVSVNRAADFAAGINFTFDFTSD